MLTSESRIRISIAILLDRFNVMWNKKPDIRHNRG